MKPRPEPKPSRAVEKTCIFEATTSARANKIQLTAISGIKIPRLLERLGRKPFINIPKRETKPAIITTKQAIRIFSGINLRKREINIFDMVKVIVVANPMPNPFITPVVVASAGHIPKRSTITGFSLIMPFVRIEIFSLIKNPFSD